MYRENRKNIITNGVSEWLNGTIQMMNGKKKLRRMLIEQWRYMSYADRITNPETWQTFIKWTIFFSFL